MKIGLTEAVNRAEKRYEAELEKHAVTKRKLEAEVKEPAPNACAWSVQGRRGMVVIWVCHE